MFLGHAERKSSVFRELVDSSSTALLASLGSEPASKGLGMSPDAFLPTCFSLWSLLRGAGGPTKGLVAEEVITQKAAAQSGQEAEGIADAVHHGQAPQVLFSIEGRGDRRTGKSSSAGRGERCRSLSSEEVGSAANC